MFNLWVFPGTGPLRIFINFLGGREFLLMFLGGSVGLCEFFKNVVGYQQYFLGGSCWYFVGKSLSRWTVYWW